MIPTETTENKGPAGGVLNDPLVLADYLRTPWVGWSGKYVDDYYYNSLHWEAIDESLKSKGRSHLECPISEILRYHGTTLPRAGVSPGNREPFFEYFTNLAGIIGKKVYVYRYHGHDGSQSFLFRAEPGVTANQRFEKMGKVVQDATKVIAADDNVRRVYLFGSFKEGNKYAHDIDLGIAVQSSISTKSQWSGVRCEFGLALMTPHVLCGEDQQPANLYLRPHTLDKLSSLTLETGIGLHGVILLESMVSQTPSCCSWHQGLIANITSSDPLLTR